MALRKVDRERFEAIQKGIQEQIATVYTEREAMSRLSDARSVGRRQAKVDGAISAISTLNSQFGALITEVSTPAPRPHKADPVPESPEEEPQESEEGRIMSELAVEQPQQFENPNPIDPVEFHKPPTHQEFEQSMARRLIITLDFHVLTSEKGAYSPHDQLRSAYKLKRHLSDFGGMNLDTKCYMLVHEYVRDMLNPFLVSWHPVFFDTVNIAPGNYNECRGREGQSDGVLTEFDYALDALRERTSLLLTHLKGVLDETD